jgi:hypothetical protein
VPTEVDFSTEADGRKSLVPFLLSAFDCRIDYDFALFTVMLLRAPLFAVLTLVPPETELMSTFAAFAAMKRCCMSRLLSVARYACRFIAW